MAAPVDYNAILSGLITASISLGITGWVYKTLNRTIGSLSDQIKQMQIEIDGLKKSEYKWYTKFMKLSAVFGTGAGKCSTNGKCQLFSKYEEFLKQEQE